MSVRGVEGFELAVTGPGIEDSVGYQRVAKRSRTEIEPPDQLFGRAAGPEWIGRIELPAIRSEVNDALVNRRGRVDCPVRQKHPDAFASRGVASIDASTRRKVDDVVHDDCRQVRIVAAGRPVVVVGPNPPAAGLIERVNVAAGSRQIDLPAGDRGWSGWVR